MALTERHGRLLTVVTSNPAPGAELSYTLAAGEVWDLIGVRIDLVTDGAGTPQPVLRIDDNDTGNRAIARIPMQDAIPVSTTCMLTWAQGLPYSTIEGTGANASMTAPLPRPCPVAAGFRLATATLGIDAGDDYSVGKLWFLKIA